MQTISDFILFKTNKCEEPLCESYQGNKQGNRLPEKFADCYEYHNDYDKKREPFTDITALTLSYKPVRTHYNHNPEGCLNEVEFLYHPATYKSSQCPGCPGFFCPYYHTAQEKQKWDTLLKRNPSPNNSMVANQEIRLEKQEVSKEVKSMRDNSEREQKKYGYQGYIMNNSDDKIRLEDNNDFFEVVDAQDEPSEIINQGLEVLQKEENANEINQIQEDHKLAMQLQEQINSAEESVRQNEQAVRNTEIFVQRSHQGKNFVYYEKKDNQNVQSCSPMFDEGHIIDSKGIEHMSMIPEANQYCIERIKYDGTRELKKVHAITEAEILKRKKRGLNQVRKNPIMSRGTVPFFYGSRIYIYGEKVDIHENRQNEFKCFRTNQFYDELLDKYVSGFINSRGGTIYLGISDDGKAWGIRLDSKLFQDLAFLVERKFKNFTPPVRPEQYCIEACYVYDKRTKQNVKDQYVLQIVISQGDPTELYFNDRELCYIRKQASTILLQPPGLKDELKARTRRHMAKSLVSSLGEPGFDECLKKQSKDDLVEIKRLFEEKLELIDALLKEDKREYNELLRNLGLGKTVPSII